MSTSSTGRPATASGGGGRPNRSSVSDRSGGRVSESGAGTEPIPNVARRKMVKPKMDLAKAGFIFKQNKSSVIEFKTIK